MKVSLTRLIFVLVVLFLPFLERALPESFHLAESLRPIFVFAILALGLNVVTGYTGLLNLGVAAFMAIGAYTYAILTCEIYPFQIGFWLGTFAAIFIGALAGLALGLPTIRLRGDYLAIVTMGFGEIVQDTLRNVDSITKGTQGINPLPPPSLFGYSFPSDNFIPWYYLYLMILAVVALFHRNLEHSRIGRSWTAVREDELAAQCMGLPTVKVKLLAFAIGAATCSLAGALWACLLGSSGEPGNYDFQISMIALCSVIVGGIGNISGAMIGAFVMIGLNSILLTRLSELLIRRGLISNVNVLASPNNWKYFLFGMALILMMRFRPEGILPSKALRAELHEGEA